jgi:hypothetical protein
VTENGGRLVCRGKFPVLRWRRSYTEVGGKIPRYFYAMDLVIKKGLGSNIGITCLEFCPLFTAPFRSEITHWEWDITVSHKSIYVVLLSLRRGI